MSLNQAKLTTQLPRVRPIVNTVTLFYHFIRNGVFLFLFTQALMC